MKYSAEQIKKDNEQNILMVLTKADDHKLRWTELFKKVGLSRRALSSRLQDLSSPERGVIRRFVDTDSQEYPPPVYYQLVEEHLLSAVDIFLSQLASFNDAITEEDLSVGRKLLREDLFLCLNDALLTIVEPSKISLEMHRRYLPSALFEEDQRATLFEKEKLKDSNLTKSITRFFVFKDIKYLGFSRQDEKKLPKVAVKEHIKKSKGWLFYIAENIFNPYVFHSLLSVYHLERINEHHGDALTKAFILLPNVKRQKFEKRMDRVWEWWIKDIMAKVPGLLYLYNVVRHYWSHTYGFYVAEKIILDLVTPIAEKEGVPLETYLEQAVKKAIS